MYTRLDSQFNMCGMGGYPMMGGMSFLNGGLGFGGFNIGNFLGGGCYGSYDYDAMAGYQVGSFLMNLTGNVVTGLVASRQAKKAETSTVNLDTIKKSINEKTAEKQALNTTKTTKESTLTDLKTSLTTAQTELNALPSKVDCEQAISEFKAAKSTDHNFAELKTAANKAAQNLETRTKLEAKIKSLEETEIPKAEKEIQTIDDKITLLSQDISTLEEQQKQLKKQIQLAEDRKLFGKADGTACSKRTKEDDLYAIAFQAGSGIANEADMRGAIHLLGNAQKGSNQDTIKKAAAKAKEVYEALPQNLQRKYSDSYEGILRYV